MESVTFTIGLPPECTITRITTSAGLAQVSTLQFRTSKEGVPSDMEVWSLMAPSAQMVTARCPDRLEDRNGEFLHVYTLFVALHATTALQSLPGTCLFDNWEILLDPKVIARKIIDRSESATGGMIHERTVLESRRTHR